MQKNKKNVWFKFVGVFSIMSMLSVMIFPSLSMAASVTAFSVVLSREEASTLSNQTITFTTPTGVASGQTIILTYDNSTSVPVALDFEDIDLTDDGVNVTLAAAPSGATWGVVRTSATVITFTNGTTAVAAGSVIAIEIGTHATTGATGVEQITNGPVGTTTLTLSGTFTDTGVASMSIIDDDTVAVTATVNSTLTFDLDTAAGGGDGESASPYTVGLGTIATSSVRVSGSTDSIQMIVAEADSNAPGGIVVTVRNANGANGLVSTSVPADNINSADGTMAAGTENYGICVDDDGGDLSGFTIAGTFTGDACDADTETNVVTGLSTTPATMLTTAGPVSAAHAEIIVNAAISGTTPAHNDYTDALTFIATATY